MLSVQPQEYLDLIVNNQGDEGLAIQFSANGNVEVGKWMSLSAGFHTYVKLKKRVNKARESSRSALNPFSWMDRKVDASGCKPPGVIAVVVQFFQPPCTTNYTMRLFNDSQYSVLSCMVECTMLQYVEYVQCVPFIESNYPTMCEFEQIFDFIPK